MSVWRWLVAGTVSAMSVIACTQPPATDVRPAATAAASNASGAPSVGARWPSAPDPDGLVHETDPFLIPAEPDFEQQLSDHSTPWVIYFWSRQFPKSVDQYDSMRDFAFDYRQVRFAAVNSDRYPAYARKYGMLGDPPFTVFYERGGQRYGFLGPIHDFSDIGNYERNLRGIGGSL